MRCVCLAKLHATVFPELPLWNTECFITQEAINNSQRLQNFTVKNPDLHKAVIYVVTIHYLGYSFIVE